MKIIRHIELSVRTWDDSPDFCSKDCKFLKFYNPDSCYCTLRQCIEDTLNMDDLSINSDERIYRSSYCKSLFRVCALNEVSDEVSNNY